MLGLGDPRMGAQYLGSSYMSSSYNSKDLQQDLKDKLEQFNKKLAEVQEGLNYSKSSQDPYKISLYSMRTLPKDEALDELSSKQASNNKGKNGQNKEDKDQPLKLDNLTDPQNSKSSVRRDYVNGFKEMKVR